MAPSVQKEWLVRTRSGEVLGPYSQHELMEGLQRGLFSTEDEIAPSGGLWISAQALTHREPLDNQGASNGDTTTITRSLQENTPTPTPTPEPSAEASESISEIDENTPPEEFIRPARAPIPPAMTPIESPMQGQEIKTAPARGIPTGGKLPNRKMGPFIVGMVVTFALWVSLVITKKHPKQNVAMTAQTPIASQREAEILKHTQFLIRTGDRKGALRELSTYHEKGTPNEAPDYFIPYASLLILEHESDNRAKKLLQQVLDHTTDPLLKAQAHLWMGYELLMHGQGDLGESHFLEALQLNPKDAASRFNLGRVYLKLNKFSQALDYLQLAELEQPELFLTQIYKARARMELGQLEEAKGNFRAALRMAPDRWLSYVYYGLFLFNNKEVEAAQVVMKEMLLKDPVYEALSPTPPAYYQEPLDYKKYQKFFLTIMAQAPTEDRELGRLYMNYLAAGQSPAEGKKIETLAEKGSVTTKIVALKVMLDRVATEGELKMAMAALPQDLSSFGYYPYVLIGNAQAQMGKYAEAQESLRRALVIDPKAASTHWALSEVFKRTSHPEDALSELRSLLTYHPDFIPALIAVKPE